MRRKWGYTDTTAERVETNAKTPHRQNNLVLITNRTGFPTGRLDRQGTVLAANDAAVRFAGKARHELLGANLWRAFPALARSEKGRWLRRAMRLGHGAMQRFASSSRPGWHVVFTVAPVPGGAVEVVWSYHDSQAQRPSAERVG